jgi:putative NADH-flavin reductase
MEGKFKMNMTLAILYAPEGHKPLSIARVNDRVLLAAAAQRAVCEAEATADELMDDDPVLSAVQLEEAHKLRRVLGLLIPVRASESGTKLM